MERAVSITFALLAGALSVQACDRSAREDTAAAAQNVTESQGSSSAKAGDRVRFGTPSCDACLAKQCNPWNGSVPLLAECVDKKCEEAFACFQRNHCAKDYDSVNQCYCGVGVSNDECLSENFKARGPCASLINAANESDDTRVVFGVMYASDRSVGDGAALFRCGAELCPKECVTDSAIPALGK
jgi:hypothetical protein